MVCFLENFMGQRYEKKREMFFSGQYPGEAVRCVEIIFSLSCRATGAYIASVFARSFVENVEVFESERTTNGTSLLV